MYCLRSRVITRAATTWSEGHNTAQVIITCSLSSMEPSAHCVVSTIISSSLWAGTSVVGTHVTGIWDIPYSGWSCCTAPAEAPGSVWIGLFVQHWYNRLLRMPRIASAEMPSRVVTLVVNFFPARVMQTTAVPCIRKGFPSTPTRCCFVGVTGLAMHWSVFNDLCEPMSVRTWYP